MAFSLSSFFSTPVKSVVGIDIELGEPDRKFEFREQIEGREHVLGCVGLRGAWTRTSTNANKLHRV